VSCSHTWTRSHERQGETCRVGRRAPANRAKQSGDDYQALLTSYCLERFLYRLPVSDRREHFVLKGAMLLRLWSDRPYRATLDLDLLRRGDGDSDAIRTDLRVIAATPVPPDAVDFDVEDIGIEAIRSEDEYSRARATLQGLCGKAHLTLQIDMAAADAVWPAPQLCAYPVLLDFPAPELLAYPGEAVRRTFERRRTPIPEQPPIALTREYWSNPSRPAQVRAFTRRARIDVPGDFADECARTLDAFLWRVLDGLDSGRVAAGTWPPGGPWGPGRTKAEERKRFRPYPAYKDSGVAWLGETPAHWEVNRLKFGAELNPSLLAARRLSPEEAVLALTSTFQSTRATRD
jgi:hypothetical protein